MTQGQRKEGLFASTGLSEVELTEVQQLAEICNRFEGLDMRLNWNIMRMREGAEYADFLYYHENTLVGYLAADGWGDDERELVGMVHPAYRRRRIFTALYQAARAESIRLKLQQLTLICEHSSASGQGFMRHLGAHFELAEHEMHLQTFQERGHFDDRLSLRQASLDDEDALVGVLAQSFDVSEEISRASVRRRMRDTTCRTFLASFGTADVECREPVGLLRLHREGELIGIYGFGIIPAYRGRGYGRQMLEEAIRLAQEQYPEKQIMLDVDTTNTNALGLYRSVGFVSKTTFDYFSVPLPSFNKGER